MNAYTASAIGTASSSSRPTPRGYVAAALSESRTYACGVDDAKNPAQTSPSPAAAGHPFLLYTVARIALFLAVAGILYLVGARGFFLLIIAFLISGLLSFIVLDRLRDSVSARLAQRVDRARERRAQAAAAEDDLL